MIALPAFLMAANLVQASANGCPVNRTDVRVSENIAPPRTDTSKTAEQLKAMRFGDAISTDPKFTETAGVTDASIVLDSEVRTASSGPDNGPFCVWPSVITVTLSTAPIIYVDASHGPCRQAVAMSHEMGHVEIDREVIERYVPIFRRRIASMAEAIGSAVVPGRDQLQVARSRIEDKVNAVLSVTLDALNAERMQAQRAHDSPQEYERISTACPAAAVGVPAARGRS